MVFERFGACTHRHLNPVSFKLMVVRVAASSNCGGEEVGLVAGSQDMRGSPLDASFHCKASYNF